MALGGLRLAAHGRRRDAARDNRNVHHAGVIYPGLCADLRCRHPLYATPDQGGTGRRRQPLTATQDIPMKVVTTSPAITGGRKLN